MSWLLWWRKKKPKHKIPNDIQELIDLRHRNHITKSNVELIVDDNQVNRDVLRRYLSKYKYNTAQASNGLEALQMTADTDYHIIWIDMKMPVLDGIDTVKYLRAEYPTGFGYKGFIVGVTGFADSESREQCLASGMNVVLSKPYAGEHIFRLHHHPFFSA